MLIEVAKESRTDLFSASAVSGLDQTAKADNLSNTAPGFSSVEVHLSLPCELAK